MSVARATLMPRLLGILATVMLAGLSLPAHAQSSASAHTTGYRFDALRRIVGIIQPDPDGGTPNFLAKRYTYDADGLVIRVENGVLGGWQAETIAPSAWTGFTLQDKIEYSYDAAGRKTAERAMSAAGVTLTFTQFSYDAAGRAECTATRMNSAEFATSPATACTLDTAGTQGRDRITKTIYDAAGRVAQVRKAVGIGPCPGASCLEQAYVTYSYTANGKQRYVVDANGNKAELTYDDLDRQKRWIFPSKTRPPNFDPTDPATALATAGAVNWDEQQQAGDYEEYGYDANGNRTSLRKRDGSDIVYSYDAVNRMTVKNVDANNERGDLAANDRRDVFNTYDLRGLQTAARFDSITGAGALTTYDAFGRIATATNSLISGSPQLAYQYDKNGNRTRITHPGSVSFDMVYDGLNRLDQVKKGSTVLVDAAYSATTGRLDAIGRYSTAIDQAFTYDAIGRLATLGLSQGASSSNVGWTFTRNAASQIVTEQRSNDAYAWTDRVDGSLAYTANGLNEYATVGGNTYCHDLNGNLTDDGINVYRYDVENRLVEMRARLASPSCPLVAADYNGTLLAKLTYDPMGRLHEALKYNTSGVLTKTTRFVYDGEAMVLEYDGTDTLVNRYVHGSDAEADDPLLWYPGTSTADSNARNLYDDPRGSIVLVMSSDGSTINQINKYDEWGVNASANLGRFQYTGQVWLDELGMYYYKARIYSPALGRFMQTDPIGYNDQINLYAYIGNDPVNGTDPTGMQECEPGCDTSLEDAKDGLGNAADAAETAADIDGTDGLGNQALRMGAGAATLLTIVVGTAERMENDGNSFTGALVGSLAETGSGAAITAGGAAVGGLAGSEVPLVGNAAGAVMGGIAATATDEATGTSEGIGDSVADFVDAIPDTLENAGEKLEQLKDGLYDLFRGKGKTDNWDDGWWK